MEGNLIKIIIILIKTILKILSPEMIKGDTLAGEKIEAKLSHTPANAAPIGGIKVEAQNGWFASRPSGTEDIYKICTERFKSREHLLQIQQEGDRRQRLQSGRGVNRGLMTDIRAPRWSEDRDSAL